MNVELGHPASPSFGRRAAMPRGRQGIMIAVALACATSCITAPAAAAAASESEQGASKAAVDATSVLAEAIEALKNSAMNRDKVDWPAVEAEASQRINKGEELQGTLEWLIGQLKDGHSRVLSPEQAKVMTGAQQSSAIPGAPKAGLPPPVTPSGKMLRSRIGLPVGYIRVPYLVSTDPATMAEFAQALVGVQRQMAGDDAKAWVIDIRGNVGGNMWPMLAGLTGILGEGAMGTTVAPDGKRLTWGVSPGFAWANSEDQIVFGDESLIAPDTSRWKVAVLTDQRTASSGESVTISFKGRNDTRSFGDPTRGLSTANTLVPLSNGAILAITTSVMVDRNGQTYGGPVVPDEIFGLPAPTREDKHPSEVEKPDPVLDRALEWLSEQPTGAN